MHYGQQGHEFQLIRCYYVNKNNRPYKKMALSMTSREIGRWGKLKLKPFSKRPASLYGTCIKNPDTRAFLMFM